MQATRIGLWSSIEGPDIPLSRALGGIPYYFTIQHNLRKMEVLPAAPKVLRKYGIRTLIIMEWVKEITHPCGREKRKKDN